MIITLETAFIKDKTCKIYSAVKIKIVVNLTKTDAVNKISIYVHSMIISRIIIIIKILVKAMTRVTKMGVIKNLIGTRIKGGSNKPTTRILKRSFYRTRIIKIREIKIRYLTIRRARSKIYYIIHKLDKI